MFITALFYLVVRCICWYHATAATNQRRPSL